MAFHKDFRVSSTSAVESMFENKTPETRSSDFVCNGLKTPDYEQKLQLDST